MRRSYLFLRANDIVFEYQLSEFRLSNEIGNSRKTEENKYNLHVAEWLKGVDNANLVRIQYKVVYSFCFLCYRSTECCQNVFSLQSKVLSRDLNGDADNCPR